MSLAGEKIDDAIIDVLIKHYQEHPNKYMTAAEIAIKIGVTTEKSVQYRLRKLKKMRYPIYSKPGEGYLMGFF